MKSILLILLVCVAAIAESNKPTSLTGTEQISALKAMLQISVISRAIAEADRAILQAQLRHQSEQSQRHVQLQQASQSYSSILTTLRATHGAAACNLDLDAAWDCPAEVPAKEGPNEDNP